MAPVAGPRQLPPTPGPKRLSSLIQNTPNYGPPEPVVGAHDEGYEEPSIHGSPQVSEQQSFEVSGHHKNNSLGSAEEADYKVKVVCVGDGGCGKTCLLTTYAHGYFPERYVPTVFENYLNRVRAPDGKTIELALWDTAGQEEYDRLRALSYPETNVLLVCFSVDSPASLQNVADKWLPEVAHYCPDIPIILVALKVDLRHDISSQQYLESKGQVAIEPSAGRNMASRIAAHDYMECSARTGEGLSEIFNTAISLVVKTEATYRHSSALTGPGPAPPSSPKKAQNVTRKPIGGVTDSHVNPSVTQNVVPDEYFTRRQEPQPTEARKSYQQPSTKPKKKSKKCIIL